MPGSTSDSYDPEFSTAENAELVQEGTREVIGLIVSLLGPQLHNIVDVSRKANGPELDLKLSERQWRIVRFNLLRALDTY